VGSRRENLNRETRETLGLLTVTIGFWGRWTTVLGRGLDCLDNERIGADLTPRKKAGSVCCGASCPPMQGTVD